jgi:aryl-phospho-beta-D-glucosidase BglC (GH1 family)
VNRLGTASNRIADVVTGETVRLRGVNRSGLEYAHPDALGFASGAGITPEQIDEITAGWGANIIRLPFSQDRVFEGFDAFTGEDYLRDIDRVIQWASERGAYTLLDLQWIGGEIPPLPNEDSVVMWRMLARRYGGNPDVLYDIFNEPHDCTMWEWKQVAERLIDAIRGEAPNALVFVSGIDWGYDLRGMPLDIPNLVYSTHIYRNKGNRWEESFGRLARTHPVFAGECGGTDDDLEWGRALFDYLDFLGMGFTAWSWSDRPHLISGNQPTKFGQLVREVMAV